MILATVGTQLPFDRLIGALDELAPKLGVKVVAQIGAQGREPVNIEWRRTMEPRQFEALFLEASVIVAHAGIGTVLAAKRHRKPIIIVPRRAAQGEHRNDHQMATARQLGGSPGIYVAHDIDELGGLLSRTDLERPSPEAGRSIGTLHSALRNFIQTGVAVS